MRAWIVCVVVLAGCGSWSKPEGSPAQLSLDQQACAEDAAKAHPPQIMVAPTMTGTVDARCSSIYGTAQCMPLSTQPPGTQTDLNTGARGAALERCMQAKGYRFTRN